MNKPLSLSRQQMPGAPYLARFLRDVGYRDCLLTSAPAATELPAENSVIGFMTWPKNAADLPAGKLRS
jgi:hypothetical protein